MQRMGNMVPMQDSPRLAALRNDLRNRAKGVRLFLVVCEGECSTRNKLQAICFVP